MDEVKGIYHSHTKYSKYNHGKNSVQEMVDEADRLGLKEYAITDHGCRHIFGIRKKKIQSLKNDIIKASANKNVKVYMGLEFNLLGNNGETDFVETKKDLFDIKLVGAHLGAWVGIKSFFTFYLPNLLNKNSKKRIEKNTDAYIKAIKKYHFDVITHPNEFIKVNIKRLAKACAENNCYLELNEKHMNLTNEDVQKILETDCKFIIGSDAHAKERILSVEKVKNFIKDTKIPLDRVANFDKLPNFANKYGSDDKK